MKKLRWFLALCCLLPGLGISVAREPSTVSA